MRLKCNSNECESSTFTITRDIYYDNSDGLTCPDDVKLTQALELYKWTCVDCNKVASRLLSEDALMTYTKKDLVAMILQYQDNFGAV